jgi:hypothetical protein
VAGRAEDDPEKKLPTPQEQFKALHKEHTEAQQAFFKALNKARTPEDRQKVMKDEAGKIDLAAGKLVALAEKHPKEPGALDALFTGVQSSFTGKSGAHRKKAIELLARDHITSARMGTLCQQLTYGYEADAENLLRAVLEKNPSKAVKAEACLALSQNLAQRAIAARQVAANKDFAKRYEESFGKETAERLAKADPAKLEAEGEKLSKEFADKYVGEMKTDRLVQVCQNFAFSRDKGSEALLRKLKEHEKPEVKGVALVTLAQILKRRADQEAASNPTAAEKLLKDAETMFEEAAEKYADIKAGFRGTVGQTAKRELFEIRHLSVGKSAPEVEGEDQDGKKFKLADYKGKVVFLDFWSQF